MQLRPSAPERDALELVPLSAEERAALREARGSPELGAALEQIIGRLAPLPPLTQLSALRPIAQEPARAELVAQLLAGAGDRQRTAELALLVGCLGDRLDLLGAWLDEAPGRIDRPDRRGRSALTLLSRWGAAALHPELAAKAAEAEARVAELLERWLTPRALPAGRPWSRTAIALEQELSRLCPAEYARLVAGLCGAEGAAETEGGNRLPLSLEHFAPRAGPLAVQVLHDALVRAGGGADALEQVEVQCALLAGVFLRPYRAWDVGPDAAGSAMEFLRRCQAAEVELPLWVALDSISPGSVRAVDDEQVVILDPLVPESPRALAAEAFTASLRRVLAPEILLRHFEEGKALPSLERDADPNLLWFL